MNTCQMFCAACICGVCAAFTTPRQTIPLVNPSDPFAPVTSSRTNWSYGMFSYSAVIQPRRDLLAPAVDVARALVVVAQQIVPERQPVRRVAPFVIEQPPHQRCRASSGLVSATNFSNSSGGGSNPMMSR